ncbi:hypothetical protein TNCV_2151361 [Trichonephila clavipes]|uniref:Uncharacterized protein n=1 Tax=Trichonephila clavipes TaxID=2585209 RepID=A0A8X6R748_TRICX|nr:hypothetical protein TNCV_2151361 [Trichonephila clavipes]
MSKFTRQYCIEVEKSGFMMRTCPVLRNSEKANGSSLSSPPSSESPSWIQTREQKASNATEGVSCFPFEMEIHFRRKSPTSFPKDTSRSYSGFELESTQLHAAHPTGWAACIGNTCITLN